jgi:hypothetical protein
MNDATIRARRLRGDHRSGSRRERSLRGRVSIVRASLEAASFVIAGDTATHRAVLGKESDETKVRVLSSQAHYPLTRTFYPLLVATAGRRASP